MSIQTTVLSTDSGTEWKEIVYGAHTISLLLKRTALRWRHARHPVPLAATTVRTVQTILTANSQSQVNSATKALVGAKVPPRHFCVLKQ
jgi:uncharacterized membrane protein (UPF0136 family)